MREHYVDQHKNHITVQTTDTETGNRTEVIIDEDGNQVHLGDQVDDDTAAFLNDIAAIFSLGEEGAEEVIRDGSGED